MSSDNPTVDIKEIIDNGIIVPGAPMIVTINEIRAIFKMFDDVDGFTEPITGYDYKLQKNWIFDPIDTWPEIFAGTGFHIDVDSGWKKFYADIRYILEDLGGGMFAGMAFADGVMGNAVGIADVAWKVEWDYDVSHSVGTYTKVGNPPMCPLAIFGVMDIEGVATANPIFGGAAIGIGVAVGDDGTKAYGFKYSSGDPTPWGDVPAVGRFKVTFDGIDHYYFYYSENDGETWIAIGDFTDTLPVDYAIHDAMFRGGVIVFSTDQTIDVRMNDVSIGIEVPYIADAYRPLQNGINGWGYLMDMLGYKDDVGGPEYKTFTPPATPLDGCILARLRDPGPPPDFRMLGILLNGCETYETDAHVIVPFCDGTDDVHVVLVDIDMGGGPIYIAFLVNTGEVSLLGDLIISMGGTVADSFLVHSNNGANADYGYDGPGPIPPTPPTPTEGRAGGIDFSGIDKEMQDDVLDIQY